MPNQNSGEPTLHRQTGTEILAKTVHYEQKPTGRNFPDLSTNWIFGSIDGESNGHSKINSQLCVVSLATCNKLFKILAAGDKV
jgi:hypothetical protein